MTSVKSIYRLGFTKVELMLVVIGTVLVSLLLPAVLRIREAGNRLVPRPD